MGKLTICSNCEADQRLCFRYMDSTIPLLSKSKISSLYPSSVTVQPGLCLTWSETQIVGFLTHRLICHINPFYPVLGLDDYEATGVDLDQIIIGIPWFGYNYTCETFSNNSNSAVCISRSCEKLFGRRS